jgi:hypothetical protein
MPDTNYSFVTNARRDNDLSDPFNIQPFLNSTKTVSALQLRSNVPSGATPDSSEINVAVFR